MEKTTKMHCLATLLDEQSRLVHSMATNESAPVWNSEWALELMEKYNSNEEEIKVLRKELGL